MERLTERFTDMESGFIRAYHLKGKSPYDVSKAVDKLGQFEDMEEQGRIVKLPCKVGDTLYRIDVDPNITEHDIIPYYIDNIVLCDDGDILFKYDAYDGIICGLKSLTEGEPYLDYYKVFLTREQAEQALQALKQEQ